MERIGPAVRPKPAYIQYKRSRPAVAAWVAAFLFGVVAVDAGAKNELLRGHVSINERQNTSTPKVAVPKATADLSVKYGSAASSPAIAGAIKKAEKAPDARTVSDAQAALAHGIWKPGADPNLAVMYGNVPPGWSQQQAAMLYTTLPHLPRMPESITAENADRFAGVPDPLAGLPEGFSPADVQAGNEQMYAGRTRAQFGPIAVPPLHRDHSWLAEHARKVGNGFVVQNDHQISLISPEYSGGKSGSIREMTDSSGNIVYQQSFDPYGNSAHLQGSGPQPDFGYQGYYVHQRSGLNLTATRAYSPQLGRFLNRDPIEEYGGSNLFEYANNNPINFSDPSGLQVGVIVPTAPRQQQRRCPVGRRPPRRPLPLPRGRGPDCDEGPNRPPRPGTNKSINTLYDCINWCGEHCSDSPPPPPNPGFDRDAPHFNNCVTRCMNGHDGGGGYPNTGGTTNPPDK